MLIFFPLLQVDTAGLEQVDAPAIVDNATPDLKQKNNPEIDARKIDVPKRSMPADQDIQLRINTTAVLSDDVMETLVQHLRGLNIEHDIKAKEIVLSVWDFAGQHVYYTSHPVFLSPRAVYVLVYNLSKNLSAQADPIFRQRTVDVVSENPTNQTNLENLLSWLVSVHCIRPTAGEPCLRPPVLIVGTHADKPFEDIREMEKCIQENVCRKAYTKQVVRPFFAVDNTGSLSDYGVQQLQNKIMEVLKEEPYMGEEIPIRYSAVHLIISVVDALDWYDNISRTKPE